MHRLLFTTALVASCLALPAGAQGGPPPHVRATMSAIERAFDSRSDSLLRVLVDTRFAPAYRANGGTASHVARLKTMREKLGGMFAGVGIERDDEGFVLSIGGATELRLRVVLDDAGLITRLDEMKESLFATLVVSSDERGDK